MEKGWLGKGGRKRLEGSDETVVGKSKRAKQTLFWNHSYRRSSNKKLCAGSELVDQDVLSLKHILDVCWLHG